MNELVIDASIAAKRVIEEPGTREALALRAHAQLIAPELLTAECANILWKKVQRNELTKEEALLAADGRLLHKLTQSRFGEFHGLAISLHDTASGLGSKKP
ncbi:MAG: type II toxin-antitoxin system VapC family toxin [Rhizomicrobium sp.]